MQKPDSGPLLIADITGYTMFLNESELIHAEQALSALLGVLLEHTRPPMIVSNLEGDAVLSYGIDGTVLRGQPFVESVEACYVEFRRAIELMVLNTSCPCNACANLSALDLKFLVHHGDFILSEAAGRSELLGSDVNLIHRLLKNSVTAETGITAYIMYTEKAVEALGLGALSEAMTCHVDSYVDFGDLKTWVEDLGPVWEVSREESAYQFDPGEVLISVTTVVDLPPELVWSYLLDTEYRKTIIGSDRQEMLNTTHGRAGVGTVYQCYHGDRAVASLILEWKPLHRVVTRDTMWMFGGTLSFPVEYLLEPVPDGTRITQRGMAPSGSWPHRGLARFFYPRMTGKFQNNVDAFRDRIEKAHREQQQHAVQ